MASGDGPYFVQFNLNLSGLEFLGSHFREATVTSVLAQDLLCCYVFKYSPLPVRPPATQCTARIPSRCPPAKETSGILLLSPTDCLSQSNVRKMDRTTQVCRVVGWSPRCRALPKQPVSDGLDGRRSIPRSQRKRKRSDGVCRPMMQSPSSSMKSSPIATITASQVRPKEL
jgi:hypothetical protein